MALLEDLQWRHAVKAYDSSKQVSVEDLKKVIEAMRLAPSSSGLQPFRVLLAADKETKAKVSEACYGANAEYVVDSSYTLILAAWDRYTEERIKDILLHTAKERNLPDDRYDKYAGTLKKAFVDEQTAEENLAHISKQAYIALGLGLAQAAELRISSTPIEGYNPVKLDEILKLDELGLKSLCLITLGYSDPEKDWLAPMKKVRQDINNFLVEL